MAAPTATILAAAASSDGGLGLIGTVPIAGVLYVRCPVSDKTGRVKWRVLADKSHTVQLYLADTIVQSQTLTLASMADGETLIINGLTHTGKDAGTTIASRFFNTGGADATADAAALALVINAAASGTLGITATSALGVVTIIPSAIGGAYVIQAVTGTAAGHCTVASTTLAGLESDGAPISGAANTTTKGYTIDQYNDGRIPYLGITNADGGAVMTPIVSAVRFRS